MSRIGRKPIAIDAKVKVTLEGSSVSLTGPKGSAQWQLPAGVQARQDGAALVLESVADDDQASARHGLARSILQGMAVGVLDGYRKSLEIQGIGFRGQVAGRKLTLQLGYSHPVEYEAAEGLKVTMPDATHIVIEGVDKQLVGQAAAAIRRFRPPDAYKGKGVRYVGEQVSLKEGKTVG